MIGKNLDVWAVVRCATYNQAQYIKDALDGFCRQMTDFDFVCTIENDASTDETEQVLADYLKENFDIGEDADVGREETDDYILMVGRHKTNQRCHFAVYNLKYNHYCKKDKTPYLRRWLEAAKYMAICEGDDYWTDNNNLNEKVGYLEEHPGCGMVYSKATRIDGVTGKMLGEIGSDCMDFPTLLKRNDIPTVTAVMRMDMVLGYQKEINPLSRPWKMGDYPLWLWIAEHKGIKFLNKATATYRLMPNSASHSPDAQRTVGFIDSTMEIQKFFAARSGIKFDDGWVNQNYKYVLCKRLAGMARGEKYTAEELALMYSRVKGVTWRMWLSYLICRMGLAGRWMEKLGIVKKKWSG